LGFCKQWFFKTLFYFTQEPIKYFEQVLQVSKDKILFCDHHNSHAYATALNLDQKQTTLIFTMDGEGDGISSTVNTYTNFELKRLSENPVSVSMGYVYTEITKLLGMIPNEHEFKVMGLAPYGKQEKARKLYEKFKDLLVLDENLNFKVKFPTNRLEFFFLEKLYGERFDTIAAFIQIFLEEKVLEWIKAWIKKTGIKNLVLSGGVFMNVKLNQKILELPEVENLFVMPSCADESTAIGAAFYGHIKVAQKQNIDLNIKAFTDLYLGKSYKSKNIEKFLKECGAWEKYNIEIGKEEFEIEKKVARLLSENKVVGRFSGRSEWGARALGNRSILANAQSFDTVRTINEMIKNRDFWMPFATSILEDDVLLYLKNPKKHSSPYMAITFNTTKLAWEHLRAAIHSYDFTSRPQVVYKTWNPSYYKLILEFKNLTGIGGILNTSFNLHGEPNVETPEDALRTFENSGLEYLALENFLISKK
jgi:carbamoyltransferase